MRPRNYPAIALAGALLLGSAGASSAGTDFVTCGQIVTGSARLVGDLDCTGTTDPAVTLTGSSPLDLQGFTLTGGDAYAVECEASCSVVSTPPGGVITGSDGGAVIAERTLLVEDTTITANGGLRDILHAPYLKVRDCTVEKWSNLVYGRRDLGGDFLFSVYELDSFDRLSEPRGAVETAPVPLGYSA